MTKKELMQANGELQRALDAAEYKNEVTEAANNRLKMEVALLKQEVAVAKQSALLEEEEVLTPEEKELIFNAIEEEFNNDARPFTYAKHITYKIFKKYSAATTRSDREYWLVRLKDLFGYWNTYFQEGEEAAAEYRSSKVNEVLKKYGLEKKWSANLLCE